MEDCQADLEEETTATPRMGSLVKGTFSWRNPEKGMKGHVAAAAELKTETATTGKMVKETISGLKKTCRRKDQERAAKTIVETISDWRRRFLGSDWGRKMEQGETLCLGFVLRRQGECLPPLFWSTVGRRWKKSGTMSNPSPSHQILSPSHWLPGRLSRARCCCCCRGWNYGLLISCRGLVWTVAGISSCNIEAETFYLMKIICPLNETEFVYFTLHAPFLLYMHYATHNIPTSLNWLLARCRQLALFAWCLASAGPSAPGHLVHVEPA